MGFDAWLPDSGRLIAEFQAVGIKPLLNKLP